jgi:hypothetical protein
MQGQKQKTRKKLHENDRSSQAVILFSPDYPLFHTKSRCIERLFKIMLVELPGTAPGSER